MKRKPNLIHRSFWHYIVAAVLSMSAMNLKSIVDGLLMGNLLGSNALSAINVTMPVVSCIGAVGLLFSQGPAIQMAKLLGARENEKASQIYSLSLAAMLAVCIALTAVVLAGNLATPIAKALCVAPELLALVEQYVGVLLTGCTLLIFENGLSTLINVMGDPKIVTIGMAASMGVNIAFDVLNVKVFGMGIAGAASATLIAWPSMRLRRRSTSLKALPIAASSRTRRFIPSTGICRRACSGKPSPVKRARMRKAQQNGREAEGKGTGREVERKKTVMYHVIPLIYAASGRFKNTIRFAVEFFEDINPEALNDAAKQVQRRYPNFP